jgi:hypothetical protein
LGGVSRIGTIKYGLQYRGTALARTSTNSKLKTRPLVREGSTKITNPQLSKKNISRRNKNWLRVPDGCLTPRRTGRLTVGRNLTSTLTSHLPFPSRYSLGGTSSHFSYKDNMKGPYTTRFLLISQNIIVNADFVSLLRKELRLRVSNVLFSCKRERMRQKSRYGARRTSHDKRQVLNKWRTNIFVG